VSQDSGKTPASYSREEAAHIRARALNPDLEIVCPRCGEALIIGPPLHQERRRGRHVIRLLTCHACHRCLSISDMPK
jgi:hypothetical protein